MRTVPPTEPPPAVSEDDIARRAYELFVEQGWQHGRDLEHWLIAEQEIRARVNLSR